MYCDVVNVKPCFNFSDEIMSNLELLVLKYTICVIVYCDVVNVQPCFNFSDEIIK